MAAPVTSGATFNAGSPDLIYPSVVNGEWVTVCTNAKTAVAAAVLLNPRSYSSDATASAHAPLIVGFGTRVRLFATYDNDEFAPTGPAVRVYGSDKVPDSAGAFPAGTIFWRLDSATFTGTSTTLTLNSGTDQYNNSNQARSNPTSATGYTLLGAKAVLVLTATGGTAGGNITVQAQVING